MDDRALGEQLLAGRIITPQQLENCLAIQRNLAAMGVTRGLEEVLRDQKIIGAAPSQPLSTVPPNSLRRIKCGSCGARVLVAPGQNERGVVCKQCGTTAIAQPHSAAGRSATSDRQRRAEVDFEPTLPTLELLSGATPSPVDNFDLELPTIPRFTPDSGRARATGEEPTDRTAGPGPVHGTPADDDGDDRAVLGGRPSPASADQGRRRESSGGTAAVRGTRAVPARRRRNSSGSSVTAGGLRSASGTPGLVLAACAVVVLLTAAALYIMGRDDGNHTAEPAVPVAKGSPSPPPVVTPTPPPPAPWETALKQHQHAVAQGDDRAAFDALLRYIELQPQDGERRRALVELGVRLEETDALLPHLEAMIAGGRDRPWALRVASDVHDRAGRRADALAALEQVFALQPSGELRAKLMRMYFEGRQLEKFLEHFEKPEVAEAEFETLADLRPAIRAQLLEHFVPAFRTNQQTAQLAAAVRGPKLARFDPESWFFQILAGVHAANTSRDNSAVIAAMTRGIDLLPKANQDPIFPVLALTYRSWAQFNVRQYDLAIADSARAIELCEASAAMATFTVILNAVYAQKKVETYRRLLTVYSWCADSYQARNVGIEQFRQGLKALGSSDELATPEDAYKAAQFYLFVSTDTPGSPLSRADKVLRVAGEPIKNRREVYKSWADLAAKRDPNSTLTVKIERGDRELEVVIRAEQLQATSEQFRVGVMQLRVRSLD